MIAKKEKGVENKQADFNALACVKFAAVHWSRQVSWVHPQLVWEDIAKGIQRGVKRYREV